MYDMANIKKLKKLGELAPAAWEGFIAFAAAGHRLPVAGVCGAFEKQHLQVRSVDQDQYRHRSLVWRHSGAGRVANPSKRRS